MCARPPRTCVPVQAFMVNEFEGLQNLQFNAKGAAPIYITGNTWLVNFDVNVLAHRHLVGDGVGALLAYGVGCFLATYVALAFVQKHVK